MIMVPLGSPDSSFRLNHPGYTLSLSRQMFRESIVYEQGVSESWARNSTTHLRRRRRSTSISDWRYGVVQLRSDMSKRISGLSKLRHPR